MLNQRISRQMMMVRKGLNVKKHQAKHHLSLERRHLPSRLMYLKMTNSWMSLNRGHLIKAVKEIF
jgi:hypothetical protein